MRNRHYCELLGEIWPLPRENLQYIPIFSLLPTTRINHQFQLSDAIVSIMSFADALHSELPM